jgi:hypothetical protein
MSDPESTEPNSTPSSDERDAQSQEGWELENLFRRLARAAAADSAGRGGSS